MTNEKMIQIHVMAGAVTSVVPETLFTQIVQEQREDVNAVIRIFEAKEYERVNGTAHIGLRDYVIFMKPKTSHK